MREVTLKVEFKVPQATELEKLEKKSLVTFIYVGKPTAEFRKKLGNESRIQLNDSYAEVAAIQDYIIGERPKYHKHHTPIPKTGYPQSGDGICLSQTDTRMSTAVRHD